MKKKIIFGVIAAAFVLVLIWFGKMNSKPALEFETEKPYKATIERKAVATGKVVPLEEVEIKPQISGIIDKIYVEEGAKIKKGDLIATVRVVPNEQSLSSARGRINSIQIQLNNAKIAFDRNKALYEKGVISRAEFENVELAYNQAKQDLQNAQNDYQIVKKGFSGSGGAANTNIRATTSGMILEIPVKEGYQVIESNNFNAGTTIAFIADMNKMIFEGQVDEAQVGKLKEDSDIEVVLGAIDKKKFPAKLTFIAPKGTEENGAVQFKIKADVSLDSAYFVRAGYSANADIVLEKKDSVLSIKEALLQFDRKTEKPFVEVKTGDNEYERKDIEIGISDGVNVEVVSGITEDDEIKVWNKVSKKLDENENN
ncbi:efflux RND transporter periplasmic adaptor subunit [Aureibaculum marinum]|uniref:Efflux RND transporter periplasmic adaptor subunit n=1 Tax=Aureibaculum marinum TaxID=2487930 RepID=A0A3N4P227_9FLAO|nr:efflux RND transporter periplasmic adaptor subunit [Aureibaculum marinum]RPD98630.1 efflux RND transporter periplasmic adaptor subunit [Aureibaculum marinum]